jgi:hypothetical protein
MLVGILPIGKLAIHLQVVIVGEVSFVATIYSIRKRIMESGRSMYSKTNKEVVSKLFKTDRQRIQKLL